MDIRRATRGFNSKNWCDFRTYSYLMPTFAFDQTVRSIGTDYRISDGTFQQVGKLLTAYVGTKNFHNYTIKKKATDASANRFIHSFACETPFVRSGVEWVHVKVKGQSFMMHQIRKMIGMVISICRGISAPSALLESLTMNKVGCFLVAYDDYFIVVLFFLIFILILFVGYIRFFLNMECHVKNYL